MNINFNKKDGYYLTRCDFDYMFALSTVMVGDEKCRGCSSFIDGSSNYIECKEYNATHKKEVKGEKPKREKPTNY